MSSWIETYRVSAYNTAKQSENKMHDDTVAKRFGFSGGLVPGVDVMAYMMHMPVARWGRAFLEHGLIDARAERRLAESWVERLNVRTPSINSLCLNLSGGNQQKVVLAKWLNAKAKVLILDHPTRGLDVGAKEEVYELVRAITAEGVAVVLTSDTLEETIGLSHTVLVMRDGAITYTTEAKPGHKPRQVDLIGHMV